MELYHSVKHHCSYLIITGFIGVDISIVHGSHQNYYTAGVPSQMDCKNSLTGYGYEILVPLFCRVVRIGAGCFKAC